MKVTIHNAADVVGLIGYQLGFWPSDSFVAVSTAGELAGSLLRADGNLVNEHQFFDFLVQVKERGLEDCLLAVFSSAGKGTIIAEDNQFKENLERIRVSSSLLSFPFLDVIFVEEGEYFVLSELLEYPSKARKNNGHSIVEAKEGITATSFIANGWVCHDEEKSLLGLPIVSVESARIAHSMLTTLEGSETKNQAFLESCFRSWLSFYEGIPENNVEDLAKVVFAIDDKRFRDALVVHILTGDHLKASMFIKAGNSTATKSQLVNEVMSAALDGSPASAPNREELLRITSALRHGYAVFSHEQFATLMGLSMWWLGNYRSSRNWISEALLVANDSGLAGLLKQLLDNSIAPAWLRAEKEF